MRLLRMLVAPVPTIAEVLAAPRDRMAVPLVVLATLATLLRRFSWRSLAPVVTTYGLPMTIVFSACFVIGSWLVSLAVFYVYTFVAAYVARVFEGRATPRAMRSAVAWGLVPLVCSLAYRLPMSFFRPPPVAHDASFLSVLLAGQPGWFAALFVLFADVVVFFWCAILMSVAVAEAAEISVISAMLVLALTALTPLIVVAAAVFAFR